LSGAALDVFATEPLPPDDPLWDAPNLLLSAHTVDNVPAWEERVVRLFVDSFRLHSAGQPLPGVVDKRRGY
jgi:phosphoglycerate dehydrogenase-like enzyme